MRIRNIIPILFIVSLSCSGNKAQNRIEVNSEEVSVMLQKDSTLIVLDVRTPGEFNAGHLQGAINIDIREPDALNKIDLLNHNSVYVVHCRTNHRSTMAVDHMVQSGFKKVYQMMDGITGWNEIGLPLVK